MDSVIVGTGNSKGGQHNGNIEDNEQYNLGSVQYRKTLFTMFPFLLRAIRYKAIIYAFVVFAVGTTIFAVNLNGFVEEFDTRFRYTHRVYLDSLQLWLAICGSLMMMVSGVQLVATLIKGVDDVSSLFLLATYAQSAITIVVMSLLDHLRSGAQFLLLLAPIIGTTMDIDVRIMMFIWGFGIFAFIFHTVNEYFIAIVDFNAPERPILSMASYILASTSLVVVPQVLYHYNKHEQARLAACEAFATELCELLADLNVQGARRRIDEELIRSRNKVPHTSTVVVGAASKLVQNLANFRSYVPSAILNADEFEDSDTSDIEDHLEESHKGPTAATTGDNATTLGRSGEITLGMQSDKLVEKSLFKKRWSTVMYIEIFVAISDPAKADYIAARVPDAIIPHVMAHRGVIDLLAPTAVIATFNCHIPCVIHESEACACALAIAADLSLRIPDVNFNIAIASGYNFIGSCGNDQHRARVVVGDTIRFVMKIPTIARRYLGSRIIVSEDTASKIGYELAPVDNVCPVVKGVGDRVVTIYEVRSNRKENSPAALLSMYNGAFSFLRGGDYSNALDLWQQYLEKNPEDLQAQRLQAICEAKAKALLKDSTKPSHPYVRKELQWEGFEGESGVLKKIYERYRHDNAANIEDYTKNPATHGAFGGQNKSASGNNNSTTGSAGGDDSGSSAAAAGGAARDIGDAVRKQFLHTERMEYQEDGLVPMFVIADSDDDQPAYDGETFDPASEGEMSPLNGPFHTNNDALSSNVPRNFEDSYHNKWQRSDNIVGVGAFSQVYLALGEQGNLVAMKCFILANRLTKKEELITEVETLSSLRNDYIVGYVSYAITANHFIILMEYVSGGSLYQLLHQFGPLPAPAARRYLIDVLKGLRYLHENNTTHCDIKPHNVLLSNDGTCKLSDFGSSVSAISQQGAEAALDQELVKGTSWYLAPEAARGDVRTANDIWSIGVTLLEVLTGKQPWDYTGGEANFIIKLGKDPTMIPEIPASIQGEGRKFIMACLERDPERRPTVHQLLMHPFLIG